MIAPLPATVASDPKREPLFSFEKTDFRYDPYPIGLTREILPPDYYAELVETWPPTELFKSMEYLGNKWSLSQLNHPQLYHRYVRSHPAWLTLYRYIKSRAFHRQIIEMMYDRHIDLGLGAKYLIARRNGPLSLLDRLKLWYRTFRLSTRFEFSMLPADGGSVKPHTDDPRKIVSLVLPILRKNEWDPAFGGGTEILKTKDVTRNYNFMNRQMPFEECEVIDSLPYEPNQAVVFVKTFNSLHAVHPIHGPKDLKRKTLTIVMEVR